MRRAFLLIVLLTAGCEPWPAIPPASETAAPPTLLPQERIDARIGANLTGPETEQALEDRAAALKARAENLR